MYSVEELQKIVSAEIESRSKKMMVQEPNGLFEPIAYSLDMGGKRLRPVLLLLAYNMFADDVISALPAALGIEVFHNFTLLHDDIMDKADVRRNRPTVHKAFNENAAILSGDAMAFQAYKYMLECKSSRLTEVVDLFTQTAIEVCEGQQYDMDFETRLDVTEAEYLEMIRLKTAVLLACSLKAGAVLANASVETADQLYEFGINLGLAFQLQDDLLDTFGNQKEFGKRIGGDIVANKKTFLLISALANASAVQNSELLMWIEKKDFDEEEKIKAVTNLFHSISVKKQAEEKVDFFFNRAMQILASVKLQDAVKHPLLQLAGKMLTRQS